MKVTKLYLGLDVHKDSITIAIAEPGRQGEVRLYGTITHDLHALEKALAKIRKAHPRAHLEVCYEAGPCGFGIARRLQQVNVPCLVAAPSLIPRKPGAPFKTDQAQRPPPETPGRLQQSLTNYLNRPTAQRGGGSLQRSG